MIEQGKSNYQTESYARVAQIKEMAREKRASKMAFERLAALHPSEHLVLLEAARREVGLTT